MTFMSYIPETEIGRFLQNNLHPEIQPFRLEAERIAGSVVQDALQVTEGDKVLIRFDNRGADFVGMIREACSKKGASALLFATDLEHDVEEMGKRDITAIAELFKEQKELTTLATKLLFVRCPEDPTIVEKLPADKRNSYNVAYQTTYLPLFQKGIRWTFMQWPTPHEAGIEGLKYDDYFRHFIRACDQPWHRIHDIQQRLIEILNRGSELKFIVNHPDPNKRTEVSMSIADFTWYNSTIGQNYPGSETATAPELDSIQGYLFAPGKFIHQGSVISNTHLYIQDGKVLENSYAENGNDALQALLSLKEGMRRFGEVAIATNNGIRRRFINPILGEKAAGTAHMALGFCHESEWYDTLKDRVAVKANNGNTRQVAPQHFDLVIPLLGDSQTLLDNKPLQINGRFQSKLLRSLNPRVHVMRVA